jgi:hypothetical protein
VTWKRNREGSGEISFEELWRRSKTLLEREATDKIKIIYRAGRVIQIEVTSPRFTTRNGISTQSDFEDIGKWFRIRRGQQSIGSVYTYRIGYGSVAYVDFLDDVWRGIAFKQHPTVSTMAGFQFEAIIVHRPGHRVLPDVGYTSARIFGGLSNGKQKTTS